MNMINEKQQGILDAPPKTTFFLGLFVGIAVTSLLAIIIVVPMLNGSENSSTANSNNDSAGNVAGIDDSLDAGLPPAPSAPSTIDITTPSSDTDYYRGVKPEDAKVVLVEYSDFECSFCQVLHPTVASLIEEYDGEISWVYRHFPLVSIHTEAQSAAEAVECAGKLGGNDAFWEFGDKLFENQAALGEDLYNDLAAEIGLSFSKFSECMESGEFTTKVNNDQVEGGVAGVTGTPATIILEDNDTTKAQLVSGALPISSFQQVIDAIL